MNMNQIPTAGGEKAVLGRRASHSWLYLALSVCVVSTAQILMAGSPPGRVVEWDFYYGYPVMHTNLPSGLTNVVAVAAGGTIGGMHSVALKSDGTVIAWDGDSPVRTEPPGLSNVVAIAAEGEQCLALKNDGTVVGWGSSGDTSWLSNLVAIAAGRYHALGLKNDSTVVAWGWDTQGQTHVPDGLSNVVAIAADDIQSVALLTNGTVVSWGQPPPEGLSNVVAIAAGGYADFAGRNLALKNDGTVFAWGSMDWEVPEGLSNVLAADVGETHYIAVKSDGTVFPWGMGYGGSTDLPEGLSNIVAIAAGSAHNLAITVDLKIDSFELTNQTPAIGFHTFSGRQYAVEYSADLGPGSWTNLPGATFSGNGLNAVVMDTNAVAGAASRFYRVKQF